ncbi:roadblock/LC7 domain-containing protein [Frankia sp. Mgl5]|uniref:Dynein regulation protein LC7 n=1 Tax=Parafrankia soli TaxID=2599596 RepID=A0A1S1PI41_9ACTN|nr:MULTISPECIES: roadblock/LC7 domain-containing protein [Frankiaceae]CAI7977019.1 Serine protease inhibitor Rv3364c [Frankia sp. Hr75.2]MCK9931521.1 roadblock/LC7 domain-containing protein [Frankia sp. Mgl5]OHV19704.1 dynein regulation protein LC7 [Parafrankia soli]TCJ36716.1 roadblock/LC7 domain-containing protein [Parafrankia sp. BMG5.11]SQE00188.1 Roadblock/LC7 family protein [Parafrankia sp. Ea1.12]
MTETIPDSPSLDWLINNFVDQVPGVANAIVASSDGHLLAVCDGFPREQAGQLGTIASGLFSLTLAAAEFVDGGSVTQTIVEMAQGSMLLMAVGDGSCLAVLASNTCDIGLVGYEMTVLVKRTRDALTPARRHEPPAGL